MISTLSTAPSTPPLAPRIAPRDRMPPLAPLKRLRCFGCILRWKSNEETYYVIVQGRHTGIWSFPKGHAHPEELPFVCARREVEEETGIYLKEEPTERIRLKGGTYYMVDLSPTYSPSPTATTQPDQADFPVLKPKDFMEVMNIQWVSHSCLAKYPINSGIRDFLERTK